MYERHVVYILTATAMDRVVARVRAACLFKLTAPRHCKSFADLIYHDASSVHLEQGDHVAVTIFPLLATVTMNRFSVAALIIKLVARVSSH